MIVKLDPDRLQSLIGWQLDGWWVVVTTKARKVEGYATMKDNGIRVTDDEGKLVGFPKWRAIQEVDLT